MTKKYFLCVRGEENITIGKIYPCIEINPQTYAILNDKGDIDLINLELFEDLNDVVNTLTILSINYGEISITDLTDNLRRFLT